MTNLTDTQHSDHPVLGRHYSIPQAAAPAWRAVGPAFGREFPCLRPGIEAEFDSLTLDRGWGFLADFPATTVLTKTLLLQWVPWRRLCQRKKCVIRVVYSRRIGASPFSKSGLFHAPPMQ